MDSASNRRQSVLYHREATRLSGQARLANLEGDSNAYLRFTRKAYEKEAKSAELLRCDPTHQMHAILHRSAATLAYRCGKFREAETLAAHGLAGNPTDRLREELYSVLDKARLGTWMGAASKQNGADDLVVGIHGRNFCAGGLDYRLLPRLVTKCALLLRNTISFINGYDFSDRAKVDEKYRISSNASANGVYKVGMNLARVGPRPLPTLDGFAFELSTLLDNIRMLAAGDIEALHASYSDESYFNNFIGLTKEIAPDGQRFTAVRWEAQLEGRRNSVAFDRARSELSELSLSLLDDKPSQDYTLTDEWETVVGKLLYADATQNEDLVRLIPDSGRAWTIVVPKGLKDDVVRPYFGDRVQVTGRHMIKKRKRRRLHLHDISGLAGESTPTSAANTLL